MVEMYRTMMTAEELEVARIVVESQTAKVQAITKPVATKVEESSSGAEDEQATDASGLFADTEEPAPSTHASPEDVPEGFARPRRFET